MEIKIMKVKQYNSTYKRILIIDNIPVCIVTSERRASECIQYINGYNADINDGKIRKILDRYRSTPINKDTEMKKRRKEKHKALHKFNESIS